MKKRDLPIETYVKQDLEEGLKEHLKEHLANTLGEEADLPYVLYTFHFGDYVFLVSAIHRTMAAEVLKAYIIKGCDHDKFDYLNPERIPEGRESVIDIPIILDGPGIFWWVGSGT